ncbi:MAG: class I SAM-dependent methyltransferase [Thermoplasmata archaeon]|nr:class I SAM-dependent methyltransferase family protein [Thermoplasmata archaeon]
MPYIRTEKHNAEKIRLDLLKKKILDPNFQIFSDDDFVYFPVIKNYLDYDILPIDGKLRIHENPYEKILKLIDIDDDLKKYVPKHWEKYGDVVLLQLPYKLYNYKGKIGEAFAKILHAKSVLIYKGVKGELRIPDTEFIYGNDAITVHIENGIYYKFDASRIMFSSGNVDERIRMGKIDASGEKIIDMFAGIGYFSLPIAKYAFPDEVISIEMNPESFFYLNENVKLNDVKIKTILSDNRDFYVSNYADRIIMGYIKTEEFVPYAMKMLKNKGMIHYHDTWTTEELNNKEIKVMEIFGDYIYDIKRFHVLKSYAPHIWHVVLDIKIRKV